MKYFSEFLPRINSISLVLALGENEALESFVPVNTDHIMVHFKNGKSDEVRLASHLADAKAQKAEHSNNVTLKFAAKPQDEKNGAGLLSERTGIWQKNDLQNFQSLKCRECDSVIIEGSKVAKVFDAPSESWAEMMDFWHCHKPDEGVNNTIKARYNDIKPAAGCIILGSYYILVNKNDFGDLSHGRCPKCSKAIGSESNNNTIKINKWSLILNDKNLYRPYYHAYEIILENMNFNASRFYNLVDEESESKSVVIWVFNFGLSIVLEGQKHDDCMKIMYYEGHEDKFEDVCVPAVVLDDLISQMEKSNGMLFEELQKMQQWKTSYLYRE